MPPPSAYSACPSPLIRGIWIICGPRTAEPREILTEGRLGLTTATEAARPDVGADLLPRLGRIGQRRCRSHTLRRRCRLVDPDDLPPVVCFRHRGARLPDEDVCFPLTSIRQERRPAAPLHHRSGGRLCDLANCGICLVGFDRSLLVSPHHPRTHRIMELPHDRPDHAGDRPASRSG